MGKIVKYCSSCDEGFAEKFGFCPDCGASLEAFELNPVAEEIKLQEENNENSFSVSDESFEAAPVEMVDETPVYDDLNVAAEYSMVDAPEPPRPEFLASVESAEDRVESESAAAGNYYQSAAMNADEPRRHYLPSNYAKEADGGYYITVIEEKNGKQRNLLLLGAALLMTTVAIGSTIYSLFNKDLLVGSIDDATFNALLIDEVPMVVEEDEQKKDKEKGGGGGGGGKEEKEETSQGDLADQQKNPVRPPDVRTHRADFELKTPTPSTEGERKFPKEFNRWGDPNSRFAGLSNGTGSGGGQGSGTGTGQGSGSGTGTGSGSGSGSGGGNGDGNGDGDGSGGNRPPPAPPARVTSPMKILAKPKATYTDAARTNNVQGSVLVKVTLLASGQIGSVTVVRGLPHGLSDRAIAAARQIRFEPKKVNGIPVTTIVTFDYGFNIY